ncbi:MAG: hypothetical protein ABSH47_10320 [Bryobacteraceae bacterium]
MSCIWCLLSLERIHDRDAAEHGAVLKILAMEDRRTRQAGGLDDQGIPDEICESRWNSMAAIPSSASKWTTRQWG